MNAIYAFDHASGHLIPCGGADIACPHAFGFKGRDRG